MNTWQTVLLEFGGKTVLLCILAWLTRSILCHWLTKDFEVFKSSLLAESASSTERLKYELSKTALEHQVRFSKLHERRAEVIADLYKLLVEAFWALQNFVSPIEIKKKKYVDTLNKITDFYRYFDINRIFLPPTLCAQLEVFINDVRKEAMGFGVWVEMDFEVDHNSNEMSQAWMKAWKYFQSEVPKAREVLESEFRRILHPDEQNYSNANN